MNAPGRIIIVAKPQIEALRALMAVIYRDAFLPPPYNKPEAEIAEFARDFPGHTEREGFRLAAAFAGEPERLAGFAYGYASRAGRWWQDAVRPALAEDVAAHWLGDSFFVAEIAVEPRFQGQGIGGRLHDELLRGLPYPRALLSTLQAESAAHRLYLARGWQVLLSDFFFPGVGRRYQVMGKELAVIENS